MRRRSAVATSILAAAVVLLLSGAAAAEDPFRIMLATRSAPDGRTILTATVLDAQGAPAPDVTIVFKAQTLFGWLHFMDGATDAAGRAAAELPPALRAHTVVVEAGDDSPVRAVLRGAPVESGAAPRVRPGREVLREISPQPGLISPYPIPLQVGLLAFLLGGVWAGYAYVVSALVKLWKGRQAL